jgi:hypothetical protein
MFGTFRVVMHGHLPDGRLVKFVETSYEGYGIFGGKDYFELLSEMNPPEALEPKLSQRDRGIDIAYGGCTIKISKPKFPQLTELDQEPRSFLQQCKCCPAQGYFY